MGLSLPVAAHLEFILLELQQVRVVAAQQEDAAAVVRVGVGDLPGAAAPAADGNAHLEGLQTHTRSKGQNVSLVTFFFFFTFCTVYLLVKDPEIGTFSPLFTAPCKILLCFTDLSQRV